MNAKIYKGVTQPNPKEYDVWVMDDGTVKAFDGQNWKVSAGGTSGGGSGIQIVDSVDKLDPNAQVCMMNGLLQKIGAGMLATLLKNQIGII